MRLHLIPHLRRISDMAKSPSSPTDISLMRLLRHRRIIDMYTYAYVSVLEVLKEGLK
jgi:hypothetical protein